MEEPDSSAETTKAARAPSKSTGGITPSRNQSRGPKINQKPLPDPQYPTEESDGASETADNGDQMPSNAVRQNYSLANQQPKRGQAPDPFGSAEAWAANFARMDKFREIIRGPMPPPPPVTPPPAAPGQAGSGVDIAAMLGLFKTMADVMVTYMRGIQTQPIMPPPAPPAPVQVAVPADPLTIVNFERLLTALAQQKNN